MPLFQTLETAMLRNHGFGRVKTRGYCGEWLIFEGIEIRFWLAVR